MKKSFNELANKVDKLTKTEEGKLKGGFATAFQLSNVESAPLGNNCKCTNESLNCSSVGNNCKCN